MRALEKRLDALEQAGDTGTPTHWRWIIAKGADAVEQAKADHISEHGDMPGAGWIVSYLAPPSRELDVGHLTTAVEMMVGGAFTYLRYF